MSKNKQGRPPAFSDEIYKEQEALFGNEVKTRRGIQNCAYRQRAIAFLGDDFPLIVDKERCMAGEGKGWRPGILTELGRIDDPEDMRFAATEICKREYTTKQAIVEIRRWRLGQSGDGDTLNLTNAIIKTINQYWKRFPKTTVSMVIDALFTATDQVESQHGETILAAKQ